MSIPDCLRRWLCSLPVRTRSRRSGRRGSLVVKLKLSLALHWETQTLQGLCAEAFEKNRFIGWHSLKPVRKWIISLLPTVAAAAPPLPGFCSSCFYRGGVCTDQLHMLSQAMQAKESTEHLTWLKMALIIARSVNLTPFVEMF